MPVLLVFADNDSVSPKHIAEFFALLGGGVKEPGWQNTQLSKSRLAIVPGYSHYNFITSAEVPQIVGKFLADPLTHPPSVRRLLHTRPRRRARRSSGHHSGTFSDDVCPASQSRRKGATSISTRTSGGQLDEALVGELDKAGIGAAGENLF